MVFFFYLFNFYLFELQSTECAELSSSAHCIQNLLLLASCAREPRIFSTDPSNPVLSQGSPFVSTVSCLGTIRFPLSNAARTFCRQIIQCLTEQISVFIPFLKWSHFSYSQGGFMETIIQFAQYSFSLSSVRLSAHKNSLYS